MYWLNARNENAYSQILWNILNTREHWRTHKNMQNTNVWRLVNVFTLFWILAKCLGNKGRRPQPPFNKKNGSTLPFNEKGWPPSPGGSRPLSPRARVRGHSPFTRKRGKLPCKLAATLVQRLFPIFSVLSCIVLPSGALTLVCLSRPTDLSWFGCFLSHAFVLHESLKHRPTYHGSVGALPPPVNTLIIIWCTQATMAAADDDGFALSPITPAEEPFRNQFLFETKPISASAWGRLNQIRPISASARGWSSQNSCLSILNKFSFKLIVK